MIKEVPDPAFTCKGCVFDGKFECIRMPCCADKYHPVKYIEVED